MAASPRVHDATVRDLNGERANALARATERLEAALHELTLAELALQSGFTERRRSLRQEALAEAGERLWYLVIQREALGLGRHEVVYEVLQVPAAVRVAMGPARRG
jgi:hypothetical protein